MNRNRILHENHNRYRHDPHDCYYREGCTILTENPVKYTN